MRIPTITLITIAAVSLACSGPKTETNSNKATTANSSNSTPTTTSLKPGVGGSIDKEAFDFFTLIKESTDRPSFVGRSATVTELDLKKVESDTIYLGYSWYFSLECRGSFTDYMSVRDVVEKRDKDGKPIKATVKGTIKEANETSAVLDPCILTDVEK